MKSRLPPRSPLFALLIAAGAAGLAAGCTDPPAGVHVIVTMDDAEFDADHLFDHLTFTARIGERRADACLYPADAVDRAVPVDVPSPNACADMREQPWTGPPTSASWALAGKPRTINVDALSGEEVEITVTGGLGGRLGTVRGSGKIIAGADFPELTIHIESDAKVFPAGCEARLEPSFPEEFDANYKLCDAYLDDCPGALVVLARSPAVMCLDDGTSRVRNGPGFTCGITSGDAVVWHTPALPTINPCVRTFVRGRFVRCADGTPLDERGCKTTTACAPQPVSLWVRAKGDVGNVISSIAMECLPPSNVPITWSVLLDLPKDAAIVGLSQSAATTDDGACFLDVEAITSTTKECPPVK